jgi:hypothetical protein
MKMDRNVPRASLRVFQRIFQEYPALTTARTTFSLADLLSSDAFRINAYSGDFKPHPYAATLKKTAKEFCEKHGLWLPGSDYYLSCALYLFPSAPPFRMLPIIKNNAIDFYLNDVMGREVFPNLPKEKQNYYSAIKKRMSSLVESLQPRVQEEEPVEVANLLTLRELEYLAPASWFTHFLELFCYHIMLAHQNCNSNATSYILDVEEYMKQRAHISGMPHTVKLIEFSTSSFIHHDELTRFGILSDFERLNWVVSFIGCLMNDLFSFEKEVVDHGSDSNLIAVLMLNDFEMDLTTALKKACAIVQNLLAEFSILVQRIENQMADILDESGITLKEKLAAYLFGAKRCVQACWTWQVYTKRYKRSTSIWKETSTEAILT